MRVCFCVALDTQVKHGSVNIKCFCEHYCENES